MLNTDTSPPVRRSQEERSAATQLRLLEATFECLVELGYARTSTPEVLRRTGISRGALLHHFPTKADLVCAAVDYVFQRQLREFGEAFSELDPSEVTEAAAVELIWKSLSSQSFYAWLELVVAARTDALLMEKVREVDRRFDEAAAALHGTVFPAAANPRGGRAATSRRFLFATLSGLSVGDIYRDTGASRPAVDTLKQLMPRLDEFLEL